MELIDGPLFLHLDITQKCNLKCIHCRNDNSPEKEISLVDIKKILKDSKDGFKNLRYVFIGGGEPLLRKNDLNEILKYSSRLGLTCTLNTNATLILKEDLPLLKKFGAIQISLDGSSAQTHDKIRNVPGCFDKALKNLKLLIENNIEVCVRMTLFDLNYTEIFELLDKCRKMGVTKFSWFRVIPVGQGKNIKDSYIDPKIYSFIAKELTRRKYEYNDIIITSSEPCKILFDTKMTNEILTKYGKNVISGCVPGTVELFVNRFGEVYPCTMLQDFKIGNIKENSIVEIWKNSDILKKLRNRNNLNGKCGICKFKLICGGCRATAFSFNDDLFGDDPYCPKNFTEAEDKIINKSVSPCQAN
jgi:radical SAM protein with 4Fe4S-binding SPASM domain